LRVGVSSVADGRVRARVRAPCAYACAGACAGVCAGACASVFRARFDGEGDASLHLLAGKTLTPLLAVSKEGGC
jgi:hypothetical protein